MCIIVPKKTSWTKLRSIVLPIPFQTPSNPSISSSTDHNDTDHRLVIQALRSLRWSLPLHSLDSTTASSLIRSFLSSNQPLIALRLLPHLPPSSPPDLPSLLSLLRSLPPSSALDLLDLLSSHFRISHPSLELLNSVLNLLIRHDIDLARSFFRKQISSRADHHTFAILMNGLCRTNRIADAFKLLQLMKRSRAGPCPVAYNTLLHALCKNGNVGRARSLMNEMGAGKTAVTFNVMICEYCNRGNVVQALVMLDKAFDEEFVPDAVAATKIIELLCREGRVVEAVELLERMEEKGGGGAVDVVSYNTLIKGFCALAKPKVARSVLMEMERKGCLPNVHSYNALISGFCEAREMDAAVDLFREMRMVAMKPNFYTFDALIRGFCSSGRVVEGLKMLAVMEEHSEWRGVKISPYNSVLYGFYMENRLEEACEFLERMREFFPMASERSLRILRLCEEGEVGDAHQVFDEMVGGGSVPSALVYASLIEGTCREGNVRKAFDSMNEMIGRGFFPNVCTFNALIRGFCEEGSIGSGLNLLKEMVGRGCCPNAASYGPLVAVLCERGLSERAYGLLVEMVERSVVPDPFIWNSFVISTSETVSKDCPNKTYVEDVLSLCLRCVS